MKWLLCLLCLLPLLASASTIEVVRVYQPISLHGTDGVGEQEEAGEPIQASVKATPYALSGAFPEELVKAVALPNKIQTNSPGYEVEEANLIVLSGVDIGVVLDKELLLITLDASGLSIPEDVDATSRQILKMTITSIIKTLEAYFSHDELSFEAEVKIVGLKESNASLANLAQKFTIGP